MSKKTLKSSITSIVMLGKVSAIKVNPAFLFSNKLIGESDFENNQIKLISDQISDFELP